MIKGTTDLRPFKVALCVGCGRGGDDGVALKRIASYTTAFACAACVMKHGIDKLIPEADRQLAACVGVKYKVIDCVRGCGRQTVFDPHNPGRTWCTKCEEERLRIVANAKH